jgi:hypothetical protein
MDQRALLGFIALFKDTEKASSKGERLDELANKNFSKSVQNQVAPRFFGG